MFVVNHMTANPVTIEATATVADASELMRNGKFRRLPIVEKGKLVGIITDRDLREVGPSPATSLSIFELNYLLAKMVVKDVMKTEVVTIFADATIEEAALLMYNYRISGLVVVDKGKQVLGIITETDIFKTFVDFMGIAGGKTRITIDVTDKVGVISEISGVFLALGLSISSLVCYPLGENHYELVIRAEMTDEKQLVEALAALGYQVKHVARIS